MDGKLKLLPLLLLLTVPVHGQMLQAIVDGSGKPITLYPGWSELQETFSTANGNGNNFSACNTANQFCQMGMFPTTAGSAWVVMVITANNVTIDHVCSGTNCTSTVTNDNWQLCPSCHVTQGSFNIDMAYNVSGTTGTTAITPHISGASGSTLFVWFAEVAPPSGFTAAFDNSAHASSASCSTCTLAAPTFAGTDAVIHFPVTGAGAVGPNPTNIFTNPYFQDFNGILFGLNVITGDAVPTYPQTSSQFMDAAISFKTTTNYTRSTDSQFYQIVQQKNNNSLACNANCNFSLSSTGSSNLILVLIGDGNSQYVSSVTDGTTTFTVPSACQVAITGTNADRLSCAYLLSSNSGKTSISITMAGNSTIGVSVWEISRSSGSFALDGSIQTGQNAASGLPAGVTLSPSGTHGDVQFQAMFCPGGCNAITLYPNASNTGTNGMALTLNSSATALLNTKNGTAPTWGNTGNATSVLGFSFQ